MTPILALSHALVEDWARNRPLDATFAGVRGHDARWPETSPDGHREAERCFRAWLHRFHQTPADDEVDGLARAVAIDWLEEEIERLQAEDPTVDLNALASPVQLLALAFGSMPLATEEDWEAVAARLEGLPSAIAGYRQTLARGRGREDGVAARQVQAGIRAARGWVSGAYLPADCPWPSLERRLTAARPRAAAAWSDLADWLEAELLPAAPTRDGVGRSRYRREMRRFLGADLDPEATYAWGWAELERLEEALATEARALGAASIPEAYARAGAYRPAPDTASFLDFLRDRQARARQFTAGLFDLPAVLQRLEVRPAPSDGNLGAYYVPPSEDFSRPGTVWYLLEGDGPHPVWREVSTAYHEGFPGHHLQLGLQLVLPGLSRFQRVIASWAGFAEGWALYAEALMDELGGYEHPAYRLGMLANQHVRGCRVVLDLGAHLGLPPPGAGPGARWTFEAGVHLLTDRAGLTAARAEAEMTRYLGFPGQALSYKVGQREILQLRDDFLAQGGTLRAFHDRVLGCGNVGLARLRRAVLGATSSLSGNRRAQTDPPR